MNKIRFAFRAVLFVVMVLALASLAHAQAARTWVSGVGDDVNPCSRTAPCKTFAGALPKTVAGGEITALDPGGFGSVIITKPITINGSGALASIIASAGSGITINMQDVKDGTGSVRLRGISINGVGKGNNGVNVLAPARVVIEDCVIDGFTGSGINASAGRVFVKNTSIRNNKVGVTVVTTPIPPSGTAKIALTDTAVVYNGTALVGGAAIVQLNNVVLFENQ